MLINVNILKSQKMILNFNYNVFIINNCDVKIKFNSINREKFYIKKTTRS